MGVSNRRWGIAIPATAIPMDGKNGVKVGKKMERYNSSHQVFDKETTIRGDEG